jgi:hypothetical protein
MREVDSENPESEGMKIAKPACVGVFEIAVRHFTLQDALRCLAQSSIVVRNPTSFQIGSHVRSGNQPNKQKRERASFGS